MCVYRRLTPHVEELAVAEVMVEELAVAEVTVDELPVAALVVEELAALIEKKKTMVMILLISGTRSLCVIDG